MVMKQASFNIHNPIQLIYLAWYFYVKWKQKVCINKFELQDSLHTSSKTHSSYLKSQEIREFFLSPQYHLIPIPLLPLSCFTQIHQTMEISPLQEISYRFTYNSP